MFVILKVNTCVGDSNQLVNAGEVIEVDDANGKRMVKAGLAAVAELVEEPVEEPEPVKPKAKRAKASEPEPESAPAEDSSDEY